MIIGQTQNHPNNNDLARRVLDGTLLPARLAGMTTDELRPDVVKQRIGAAKKKAEDEAQLATLSAAISHDIQCPKCKQYEVQYTQAQTRSADEPMTTFCFCIVKGCGHRWKFC